MKTPGQAAHDTWCGLDDWDLLDDEERGLWEETAWKAHAAIVAQLQPAHQALPLRDAVTEKGN